MAVLIANVKVEKTKKSEFIEIMLGLIKREQKELGCKTFELFHNKTEALTFSFHAIWYTYNDFIKFLKSDGFLMMSMAFKLLRKTPDIHFFNDNSSIGLQQLLALRESKHKST